MDLKQQYEAAQQEYNNKAWELGTVEYQIYCLEKKKQELKPVLLELNEKGAKLAKEMESQKNGTNSDTQPSPAPENSEAAQTVEAAINATAASAP